MQGFTLLELTIVVVIIGILAGAAVPIYVATVARAKESEGWQFLGAIRAAEIRYYTEHEEIFTTVPNQLDIADPSGPPNRLFDYQVMTPLPGTFTACGRPRVGLRCLGCRTLTLYNDGGSQSGPACP